MTTVTSICNKALIKLGITKKILNVETDDSPEANACSMVYDDILKEVLRVHNWNFAIFRQSLNKDNTTPVFGFTNRFILPTSPTFLRLLEIENNPVFRLENGYILSDENSINIRFIGKETNPNKYDSIFINLFACRIALEIGHSLTSDNGLIARIKQEYIELLSLASEKDNLEDNDIAETASSYNNSRITGLNIGITGNFINS